jgi:hypothetical protein
MDIDTYWRTQSSGTIGSTTAPIAAGDTTIMVDNSSANANLPAFPFAVMIDGEPMLVTGPGTSPVDPNVWAVTRGSDVSFLSIPSDHPTAKTIAVLKYSSVYAMLEQNTRQTISGWINTLVPSNQATTFACTVAGSITVV